MSWDLFIILLAIYNAITEPLCIGFFLVGSSQDQRYTEIRVAGYVVDVLFVVNIVLRFFMTVNLEGGGEVSDLRMIRKRYLLSGDFMLDVVSVFPFELIASSSLSISSEPHPDPLNLFKLFRLLRLRKVSTLNTYTNAFKIHFKLVLVVFYLFLYVHLTACFWSLLTHDSTDWFPPKDYGRTTSYFNEDDISQRYSTALYYGTLMLLGADAYPYDTIAMFFASGVSLVGAVLIAVLFGNMTVLVDSLRMKSKLFSAELDTANHVMACMGMPTELQTKVLDYMIKTFNTKNQQKELARVLAVMSPSLKFHLSQYLFNSALKGNGVFRGKDVLAESLVRYVRIDGCNPEAVLMQEGAEGKAMYILAIGEVSVSVRNLDGFERVVRKLGSGSFFGEVALLTESKRTATIRTLNFCTYGTLSQTHLADLLTKFPSLKDSFLQHIIHVYNDEQRTMIVERLVELPFVAMMTEAERILLYYAMQPCFFGKMQLVEKRGEKVSGLLVTVSGKLAIRMSLEKREITATVAKLSAGSLCFCSSFLTEEPLVIDLIATEATVGFRLEKASLERNSHSGFLQKVPRGPAALSKYMEKIESQEYGMADFVSPFRMHQSKKSLWKKLKIHVLAMCQQAYAKRRAEMALRVSTLIDVLQSYMDARMVCTRTNEQKDFQDGLQHIIKATIQLNNRVELLRMEYEKRGRRDTHGIG